MIVDWGCWMRTMLLGRYDLTGFGILNTVL